MRQEWEYLFVSAYWTAGPPPVWTMALGQDIRLNNWGEIVSFVQDLGEDCWELVSTTSLNYPNGTIEYAFAFKRMKDTYFQ
jgi:hypothetical protein